MSRACMGLQNLKTRILGRTAISVKIRKPCLCYTNSEGNIQSIPKLNDQPAETHRSNSDQVSRLGDWQETSDLSFERQVTYKATKYS